ATAELTPVGDRVGWKYRVQTDPCPATYESASDAGDEPEILALPIASRLHAILPSNPVAYGGQFRRRAHREPREVG
ncbi:MAG: hypothetical protein AAF493_03525, partial [Pseudomonadota bacterium]